MKVILDELRKEYPVANKPVTSKNLEGILERAIATASKDSGGDKLLDVLAKTVSELNKGVSELMTTVQSVMVVAAEKDQVVTASILDPREKGKKLEDALKSHKVAGHGTGAKVPQLDKKTESTSEKEKTKASGGGK